MRNDLVIVDLKINLSEPCVDRISDITMRQAVTILDVFLGLNTYLMADQTSVCEDSKGGIRAFP